SPLESTRRPCPGRYMRNGDFLPTRLQAQQDAVNIVCHSKTRSNPENNVGLITLANNCEVLTTLTPDTGRILSKLHTVQPKGKITFCTGIRVAHLALKHRQGKNHKMRIIAFVGSPVEDNEKDLVKLAKRLKKEKVNVDIINFGEEVRLPLGFWCESQGGISYPGQPGALLRAREGTNSSEPRSEAAPFAQAEAAEVDSSTAMDTSEPAKEEDDYDVMQDPEFLQSVLENLPGVDPNNEAIRNAMGSLASQAAKESKDKKEEEKK
uniref:Proteasome 26S subunit, non-ATPase 4 n=1 Tax=Bubo bubo TaxID=30461 RepID=A0A8C0F3T9_BUBBB